MANILFIDQYSAGGTSQRSLMDLAGAFAAQGHGVRVLFPGEIPTKPGFSTGSYRLASRTARGPLGTVREAATAVRSARSIRAAAGRGYDFLYVNGPRSILPTVLAGRRMRLPVVAAVNLMIEGRERKTLDWCFRRPHVKLVLFSSSFAAEGFRGKTKVAPTWVAREFLTEAALREQRRTELGFGNDHCVVGVLGRVSKSNGQRLFLDAGIPLLKEYPNLCLCLAGGPDGDDSHEELELKAVAGPFGERIRFLGQTAPIPFLDALDIAVIPSIRIDASGQLAKECMARSLAVIATNLGVLAETVGTAGVVSAATPSKLGDCVRMLIDLPDTRASLGREAGARIRDEYSADVLVPRRMAAILEAVH